VSVRGFLFRPVTSFLVRQQQCFSSPSSPSRTDAMSDSDDLESRWRRNAAELNRLYSLSSLARETFGARIDGLEAEQDRIKFELGGTRLRQPVRAAGPVCPEALRYR
jgi:hypothetical protein